MGAIINALFNGRMLSVFMLGMSSGLPLVLIGQTLKAWMKESHVDLTVIGIYGWCRLPYTLKFLWSPLMDRFVPPFLGRRRGWILICQVGLALSLAAMAGVDPLAAPFMMGALALLIGFLSASQDIVIDAYRREILKEEELGLGSSLAVNGYLFAMVMIASALALALADHIPWKMVYLIMAAIMGSGVIITLLSPEPAVGVVPPKNLRDAVVLPLVDYFKRSHAIEILLFIMLYKVGDSMASEMLTPFYLDLGFTKTQIAGIAKVFGLWATIGGGTLGGLLMVRMGIGRSLWVFGIFQTISTAGFCVLAKMGNTLPILTTVIVVENVCTGMARTAYVAFMAKLCNVRFTATQYALLSSLMGVAPIIFGGFSGFFAKHMGWVGFFVFCTILHLPGMLMLLRQKRWFPTENPAPAAA